MSSTGVVIRSVEPTKSRFSINVNDSATTIVEKETDVDESKITASPRWRFNADLITTVNLSQLEEARKSIFWTGCLPQWLLNFTNSQILIAARCDVIIIEPWSLKLRQLRRLNLEHNHITTWPYFSRDLENLEFVCLEGNPCLEKAFSKSPSMRSTYFNWSAAGKTGKCIPSHIRGPEWPPAASARLNKSGLTKDLDFYCGGIYTLCTPPDTSNDELSTPLTPCILEVRLHRQKRNPEQGFQPETTPKLQPLKYASPKLEQIDEDSMSILAPFSLSSSSSLSRWESASRKQCSCSHSTLNHCNSFNEMSPTRTSATSSDTDSLQIMQCRQDEKQSRLIFETFDDIFASLKRFEAMPPPNLKKHVLLFGHPQDAYNRSIPNSERLKVHDKRRFCQAMLAEEDEYIMQLSVVNTEFCNAKVKSNIAGQSREIFKGFPAMLSIHTKWIRPNLKQLVNALIIIEDTINKRSGSVASHEAKKLKMKIDMMIATVTVNLCTAYRRLHLALQTYAKNLQNAERLLNIKHSMHRLYEDTRFGQEVKSRISRMGGGFAGHLVTVRGNALRSSHSSAEKSNSISASRSGSRLASKAAAKGDRAANDIMPDSQTPSSVLSEWIYKRTKPGQPQPKYNPVDFSHLPLVRLVRAERFFTSMAKSNQLYQPLVRTVRWMRKLVATEMQGSRLSVRSRILASKFRTSSQIFAQYRWDAVLLIRSRSYFEQGILAKDTNDVLDIGDNPVSFVKETYNPMKSRASRSICCGEDIMIWDEVLEHLVGRIAHGRLIVVEHRPRFTEPAEICNDQLVRIVFVDVCETCLVQVKGFAATYRPSADIRQEFIDACRTKQIDVL